MTDIKIARHRTSPYFINYEMNGGMKNISWTGSKGTKTDIKLVSEEIVDWLIMNSACFRDGELAIIEDNAKSTEVASNIDDVEEYKNNTHSKEDVIKLLKGNINKMKSELKKVTNKGEMRFFIETAREIELDSNAKLTFLADWFGVKKDILFGE